MRYCFFILILTIGLFSCVKDKPNPPKTIDLKSLSNSILVLNEGTYGNNNAELSLIDFKNHEVANSIFKQQNKISLGDVAQSISLINGDYYITVNNSHKIVIIDTNQFKIKSIISNVQFPRYLYQISDDIAYLSSLYSPYIYVLQLSDNKIIDTIITDFPNTENLLSDDNFVWACNWDTACNYIYKIEKKSHKIIDRILLNHAFAPQYITQDKNGYLWVLSGNKYKNKTSYLSKISTKSNQVIHQFEFNSQDEPIKLCMNQTKDTLFFLQIDYFGKQNSNGLYQMSIDASHLPQNAWIPAPQNTYFWAIGIDPFSQHIYLSDPKGFTQSSTIYEYLPNGNLINTFQTGIGSNQFIFRK